jgi:hypothetical protein
MNALIKGSSLQKSVSKLTVKKFYEIDPWYLQYGHTDKQTDGLLGRKTRGWGVGLTNDWI